MTIRRTEQSKKSRLVSRSPIFYGWVIFLVSVLGLTMTSPGQAYVFSLFSSDVTADLRISLSVVSILYTVGSLIGSATLPWFGRSIDHIGSRLMVTIVAFLFGLACLYMSVVQNVLMLGIGFVMLRTLGPGGLALGSENILNQWWQDRRGMIVGLSSMLFALLGVAFIPNMINWSITQFGWRATYQVLGGALILIMTPIGYIFFRDRPEQYGLLPDGRLNPRNKSAVDEPGPPLVENNWTLAEAIHTPTFWIVSLGVGALAMFITGLLFHQTGIFNDNGLSSSTSAASFIPISIAMAIFSLSGGILLDHIPARVVLGSALIVLSAALFLAPNIFSSSSIILFGLLLGSATGLMRTLSGSIWAIYFGRLHLGSISGVARAIIIAGAALGPMPFGISRDLTGSYNSALILSACIVLVLGIMAFWIHEPKRSS